MTIQTVQRIAFAAGALVSLAFAGVLMFLFPAFLHYTVWVWTEAWKSPWYWAIATPVCIAVAYITCKD